MSIDSAVYNPNAKPLDKQEFEIALRDNVNIHREFIRERIDPKIPDQTVGLMSFKFLKNPLVLPDDELFYGWYKIRGNFRDDDAASKYAAELLKDHDSKNKIKIGDVGVWHHLTSSKLLTKEHKEIAVDEWNKQKQLEDEKMNKQLKEIQEREKKLKSGIDEYEPGSLDYYITKRVSLAENEFRFEQAMKTVRECRKNVENLKPEIEKMENDHPSYLKDALPKYNKERVDAGLEEVRSFNQHSNK